jgi:hypothetical protein
MTAIVKKYCKSVCQRTVQLPGIAAAQLDLQPGCSNANKHFLPAVAEFLLAA